ncbi:hypothetical protein ACQP2C_11920 [Micromonospora zamorensis]|uniref:hypothetical protein n=1 Tax=Micromonospora zamorensis TaxID=709883 RepID=UPI003D972FD4
MVKALANLLPGLRDLRAPLSAGFVWLMAGYLWIAPRIPNLSGPLGEISVDMQQLYKIGGSALLVSAVTFTAYLVGIVSQGSITLILDRLYALLAPASFTAFFGPALTLIAITKRLVRSRNLLGGIRAQEEAINLVRVYLTRADFRSTARRLALSAAVSAYRSGSSFRQKFASTLTPDRFLLVARRISEPKYFEDDEATRRLRQRYGKIIKSIGETPEDSAAIIQRELHTFERLAFQDARFLAFWIESLVSLESHADVLEQELTFLPSKLVASSPESYERWDRLAAEAEFRRALMAPVLGLGASLFERGIPPLITLPITVAASYFLWISSRSRTRLALEQLSQCISGGLISSPELDRIRSGNLNWAIPDAPCPDDKSPVG